MIELRVPFPDSVARLFDPAMVSAPSAWGVLEGNIPGVLAVDDPNQPSWVVGRMYWNLGFAAGRVEREEAGRAAVHLARWGEFGVVRAVNDPLLPYGKVNWGRVEFSGRRQPARTKRRHAAVVAGT